MGGTDLQKKIVERHENGLLVAGTSAVTIFDAEAMSYTTVPSAKTGESLSLFGIKLHVLSSGHRFDLRRRRALAGDATASNGTTRTAAAKE